MPDSNFVSLENRGRPPTALTHLDSQHNHAMVSTRGMVLGLRCYEFSGHVSFTLQVTFSLAAKCSSYCSGVEVRHLVGND